MTGVTPYSISVFALVMLCQLVGVALLPKTEGYTNIGYSVAQLACFGVSFALMARLLRSGAQLGILIPILSTAMPLASVLIGIAFYRESPSPLRVSMLLSACALIGLASRH